MMVTIGGLSDQVAYSQQLLSIVQVNKNWCFHRLVSHVRNYACKNTQVLLVTGTKTGVEVNAENKLIFLSFE